MEQVMAVLTILFAEPFWIGVYERTDSGGAQVSRVVFGAEPSDGQVYAWLQASFWRLQFSPMAAQQTATTARNPKRLQRQISKALRQTGVGTKAQQALKLQQEQLALARSAQRRQRREERQQRQYMLRQQKKKKKKKHRGR